MTEEINKQIELLEKYGVNNYVIENGRIVINQSINLNSLKTVDKGFLNGAIINGWFWFDSLTTAPENFLFKTTIKGWLSLDSLTTVPENFLEGATINESLYLRSLTTAPKSFLSRTIVERSVIRNNVRKYGFLSSDKNGDKMARFINEDVLEGEEVRVFER